MQPLVSMICVTNRPHFASLVRRQFVAQTYEPRELVVVDSSDQGGLLEDIADTYTRAEPGTWVGPLRNAGLDAARGDFLMWFDDDDWRHPDLTSELVDIATVMGEPMAGMRSFFWIDLDGRMERRWCPNWPVFAAAVYRQGRGEDALPPFRSKPPCKTDSYWLLRVREKFSGFGVLLDKPARFVWVNHGANVFNRDFDTTSRRPNENDKRFLPGAEHGLRRHMEDMRAILEYSDA